MQVIKMVSENDESEFHAYICVIWKYVHWKSRHTKLSKPIGHSDKTLNTWNEAFIFTHVCYHRLINYMHSQHTQGSHVEWRRTYLTCWPFLSDYELHYSDMVAGLTWHEVFCLLSSFCSPLWKEARNRQN